MFEFHISRVARDRYQFDETLFASNGNVIFANFHATRAFAQRMNQKRDLLRFPEQAVRAGEINAMGLIDEILHVVVNLYRQQMAANAMAEALDWLDGMIGREDVDEALQSFCAQFPPVSVYRRQASVNEYLAGSTDGVPNRQIALEEMIMLWLANANPAFTLFQELFDDSALAKETAYTRIIPLLHAFFESQPAFGPDAQNLIDMLRAPALASPHSLDGQLEYIRTRWAYLIGKYLYRLLSSLDFLKEEGKFFLRGGFTPGEARVLEFGGQELELERFSPDKDWMPRAVLLAKNAFVWLDQLSKKHRRSLTTLADIPDEELDTLARWGVTGLWLIGLWERSQASKEIKIRRGNPDAVASAYSLYSYDIANDLGGDPAYENLHHRCWQRGIRLASDMVPNHMGIDSRWVTEHPDWFISLEHPPFPSYSFNGHDYSSDPRYVIQIEDHYYDNSDAAVVFKLYDHWTGQHRYIYHGNDGTSMPWNDTAQLNYLKPEVREAVIQTILHVARKFPIIRFDAAMTLAKKHYQRLWFPEPGSGGDIPSRAGYGLTKADFDAAMPEEFWREVVDRVAQEVPDTLLLAEAFWLMEGYFVRTLGMHRVYNSAFMNMLRDEKNAEYRLVIKNTLEFDPEILKRYVNFMNNPDERTAVDQFGKDDKYFGVCTLMATLPGLPMLGHGQVEGFTEKYGMEYRRAYWEEQPDGWLVGRHEREIFPLLRKRYLFAEVCDFLLYDCFTPEGHVNEDVFAYSNHSGGQSSLVVYHNRYASTRGWIKTSAAYAEKAGNDKRLVQKTLAEGLRLNGVPGFYSIFREHISGLEYIRPNAELIEKGLYVELEAYRCQVYLDFRQVQDNEWGHYHQLCEYLQGRGVPNVDEALREIFLQPVRHAYGELVNAGFFKWLQENQSSGKRGKIESQPPTFSQALEETAQKSAHLFEEIQRLTGAEGDVPALGAEICRHIQAALTPLLPGVPAPLTPTLLATLFTRPLGKIISASDYPEISRAWIDEWLLGKIITQAQRELGESEEEASRHLLLVKILVKSAGGFTKPDVQTLLADPEVQSYIGVNRYQDVLWFNQEAFEDLIGWLCTAAQVELAAADLLEGTALSAAASKAIKARAALAKKLIAAARQADYRVEKLLAAVETLP
ncbi:MAG: alpha-amylase family glycosyl hydrolase [Chloroflexota bacterium]